MGAAGMEEKDRREGIKEAAVEHFNGKGYHGTTIRSIAKDVNCPLPMIYYYYNGIKVYLSFDGDEELMEIMDEWEKTILPRHHQIVKPYLKNTKNDIVTARALAHLLETLIESIVVKNRFLPEEEIREEISAVLRGCE